MIDRFECRGKALQAIVYLLSLPRATLRLPPVTNIGKPMCIAFQASLRYYQKNKNFVFCFVIPLTCCNFAHGFQNGS